MDNMTDGQQDNLVSLDMVHSDNGSVVTQKRRKPQRSRFLEANEHRKQSKMDTSHNSYRLQGLLQGYGQWVADHVDGGYHGYLLTFMFSQIPGSDASRMLEMRKHLGWFYGRLAKASVPKPSSSRWSSFLPKAILAPDLPVPKHTKVELRDVTVNNGLHWHGIFLVNPLAPKLQDRLNNHINGNLRKYLVGSIRTIDVKPITYTPEYLTGYGLKSLKSRFSTDEIVIFPRSVSELPSNGPGPREGPVRATDEKRTYDFQRI
jgi:hypothetical protein